MVVIHSVDVLKLRWVCVVSCIPSFRDRHIDRKDSRVLHAIEAQHVAVFVRYGKDHPSSRTGIRFRAGDCRARCFQSNCRADFVRRVNSLVDDLFDIGCGD